MSVNTPAIHRLRRKRPKGIWMRLRDPKLLAAYMEHVDMSQARLARHADTKRQYIHMLVNGDRRSCGPRIAKLIEEALGVLPGTLFMEQKSPANRPRVSRKETAA